jgi:hypothetical protein
MFEPPSRNIRSDIVQLFHREPIKNSNCSEKFNSFDRVPAIAETWQTVSSDISSYYEEEALEKIRGFFFYLWLTWKLPLSGRVS